MDELTVKGKKHISSKRAAEITGYAKDYIGQLARGGKIAGVRFGRAWFVDESELLAYLGNEKVKETQTAISYIPSIKAPIQAKAPYKNVYQASKLPSTWSQVTYLDDPAELLPILYKPEETVQIEVADKPIEVKLEPKKSAKPITVKMVAQKPEEMRLKALVDGIQPRSAVIRVGVPQTAGPAPKLKKSAPRAVRSPLPIGAMVAAVAVIGLFVGLSGLLFSSQVTYVAGNQIYTANVLLSFEHLGQLIRDSGIVQGGVDAVLGFFAVLADSFWSFVEAALKFFTSF